MINGNNFLVILQKYEIIEMLFTQHELFRFLPIIHSQFSIYIIYIVLNMFQYCRSAYVDVWVLFPLSGTFSWRYLKLWRSRKENEIVKYIYIIHLLRRTLYGLGTKKEKWRKKCNIVNIWKVEHSMCTSAF